MNVKCNGGNGQPSIPTSCPNLRRGSTGGFFGKAVYTCSVSGRNLDAQYVRNVCTACRFHHMNNSQYADIGYLDCNQYKIFGIRN
ncbi:MAG: hypothetical protein IJ327_01915 [Lachnospiraceae bacterium]|nr:hypothetical protein [Lachnospiraceae bacterium]